MTQRAKERWKFVGVWFSIAVALLSLTFSLGVRANKQDTHEARIATLEETSKAHHDLLTTISNDLKWILRFLKNTSAASERHGDGF